MDILSLPIEVIQLIGNDGDWQDQPDNSLSLKTLRLVCSRFNGAFEAQVLSTLVIVVMYNNLKQSLDMLRTFASQNKTTSRAVQHARTLKIKLLSPLMAMDSKFFEPEPESHDLSPGPPSLTRRLASAISSLKRRFKRKPRLEDISAIGEESMKEYLELAISSMKNLKNVKWAIQVYDPLWTEAAVIRGITRLPQLQDLQITLCRDALFESSVGNIQLECLSGLKKISLSSYHVDRPRDIINGLARLIAICPQLVHLEISLGYNGTMMSPETPTLHDLLRKVPEDHPLQLTHLALNKTGICIDSFTLPHLRSLISLDLRNLPAPSYRIDDASFTSERQARASSTADICAILKQEGIYLKNVIVSDVGAFDYLCSYSGLETLDLCFMAFNTVEESNASALTFYKSVLPQLVHSLQVLKIRPKHEGRWCFNPEDVFQSVVFSQCNKLRSLSVALNSIPNTNSLFQYKYNVDDSISSLIYLSLSLPTLSEIHFFIPRLAFESDVIFLHNSNTVYEKSVMELITRSITEFSLHDGHNTPHIGQLLPDIWVHRKELYQYKKLEGEERQRYVRTYQTPLDPYLYIVDNTAAITTLLAPPLDH